MYNGTILFRVYNVVSKKLEWTFKTKPFLVFYGHVHVNSDSFDIPFYAVVLLLEYYKFIGFYIL